MSALARSAAFEGIDGTVSGAHVLFAAREGVIEAVEVQSIQDGLGLSRDDQLWLYLLRNRFVGTVNVGGVPRATDLVDLDTFIGFCVRNSSPRLNAFRDDLTRVVKSIQNHGSYIDANAGPGAFVHPDLKDDPIAQMCGMIQAQRLDMIRLGREVQSVRGEMHREISDVRQEIGRGPSSWILSAWVDAHGKRASQDWLKDEGLRLRQICLERGIAIPARKVSSGGDYAVRKWPIEAIKVWWPECCRRMGWELRWEVDV